MRRVPSASPRAQGDLPDVNVWLALLNQQHPHHDAAKDYWERAAAPRIGFCRITMLGMLRLSTNKSVMSGIPYTAEQAWQAYQHLIDLPEVVFITEPSGIEPAMRALTSTGRFRSADWTDAYLAALARLAGLRMVSFDKGFAQYGGLTLLSP